MKKKINNIQLEILKGDITKQEDITAIVNAANAELLRGGGVAGAIHSAAGPELEQEARPKGPIKPGEAVITGGYQLPNRYVIHCLGPVYGVDKPGDKLLAACFKNALTIAENEKIESVAFPAISTGVFGYPVEEAAEVTWKAIDESLEGLRNVKIIRMVLYSPDDKETFEQKFKEVFDKQ